ncbi:MAG: ADP-ribosyltransferase [Lachnospiraceae bacterium]
MSKTAIKGNLCGAPLECYCGYSYRQINKFLRYEEDDDYHTYREMSDILSIVLSSAPRISHDVVLYRIVNDEFINMFIEKNKQTLSTPIQEKGFMSTSLLNSIANENEPYASEKNLLKIFVPKNTIGVYVNAVTSRSEEEMLLFPNMYLALVFYPYKDEETGKIVYECILIKMYT